MANIYDKILIEYLPPFLREFLEYRYILKAVAEQWDYWKTFYTKVYKNEFILLADEDGIKAFEDNMGIIADPITEDLEFRRQRLLIRLNTKPPFTERFLASILDEIVGVGKYSFDLDWNNYTVNFNLAPESESYRREALIAIARILPMNLSLSYFPYIFDSIPVKATFKAQSYDYMYRVGTSWVLGTFPFAQLQTELDLGESYLLPDFLNEIALEGANEVTTVLLNNTYRVTTFIQKTASTDSMFISYTIPASANLGTVTNIKLLDANNNVLSNDAVSVVIAVDAIMQHTIRFVNEENAPVIDRIENKLLSNLATYLTTLLSKITINNTINIAAFDSITVLNNVATAIFTIPYTPNTMESVANIKIIDKNEHTVLDDDVYLPMTGDITITYTIKIGKWE